LVGFRKWESSIAETELGKGRMVGRKAGAVSSGRVEVLQAESLF
jgi:hypothetical protein